MEETPDEPESEPESEPEPVLTPEPDPELKSEGSEMMNPTPETTEDTCGQADSCRDIRKAAVCEKNGLSTSQVCSSTNVSIHSLSQSFHFRTLQYQHLTWDLLNKIVCGFWGYWNIPAIASFLSFL